MVANIVTHMVVIQWLQFSGLNMNQPEFKIGDEVTFKPYEKSLACIVKRVQVGMLGNGRAFNGHEDDRIFYVLEGEAWTTTTGLSIVESRLFKPAIMEWDVPNELLYRMPLNRRLIGVMNYRWICNNIRMSSNESYLMTEAYNERLQRYKVREAD